MFTVSDDWRKSYPGAFAGVLIMTDVSNPERHPELDRNKKELEEELRVLFKDRGQLKSIPPIQAYRDYYKRFKKSYHVLAQLESVIFKGKSIPRVAALVEAMFLTELRNMLLTAGHNMAAVLAPVQLDVAKGTETYVKMNGQEQQLKAQDMIISDREGVISSVIYGPDKRTRITPSTQEVLFTTYAPPGVGEQPVRQHLEGLEANVRIIAPDARVELMDVFGAD
jgi:DNA/RNA-binding domain of Phe-tRNA-synthetase-like protein